MTKNKAKCNDIEELEQIIELIDDNHKSTAKNILNRIKFMNETLINLEKQIKEEGAIIEALNGNGFKTINEHPAQKSYNTMIGRYNALIKTFIDLIPDCDPKEDEFMKFINSGEQN